MLQALVVYLVRETAAWLASRGLPSATVYTEALRGPSRGWCRGNGAPCYPQGTPAGALAALRPNADSLDFAFCEIQLGAPHVEGPQGGPLAAPAGADGGAPTVDAVLGPEGPKSSPVEFAAFLHAVGAAMEVLRNPAHARGASQGGGLQVAPSPNPKAVEEALRAGDLGTALGAFAALCGEEAAEALLGCMQQGKPQQLAVG